jgi:hypothetical protein
MANVLVLTDLIPEVIAAMRLALGKINAESAQDIVDSYAQTAPNATGFMASTGYVVTSTSSTYGQGFGTPPGDASTLPEIPHPKGDMEAHAAVAASYAAFVEYGTANMGAQPAFAPAGDAAESGFGARCSKLEARMGFKGISS